MNRQHPIRIWDLPVRLVHWSFVLLMPALWASWKFSEMALHKTLGSVLLGLLVFRLGWGLWGSETARFSSFVKGPKAILAYLSGRIDKETVGHNPLGALSVVGMLGALVAQVVFGLFATDTDGEEAGPLAYLLSYEGNDFARTAHGLCFYVLLGLIGLHIAAIIYYRLAHRDNLVGAMVSGWKNFREPVLAPAQAPLWRAIPLALLAAGLAVLIAKGGHIRLK